MDKFTSKMHRKLQIRDHPWHPPLSILQIEDKINKNPTNFCWKKKGEKFEDENSQSFSNGRNKFFETIQDTQGTKHQQKHLHEQELCLVQTMEV